MKTQDHYSPKKLAILLIKMIFIIVVFALFSFSVFSLTKKYYTIRKNISQLKKQEAALVEKKKSLDEKNKFLDTSFGQESLARDKYSLVKPGESMIVIATEPIVAQIPIKKGIGHFWDVFMEGLGLRKK
jgi:cell division protein FtsB